MSIVTLDLQLPADAMWQVVWFGSLTRMPTDRTTWAIHVFFKRFESDDASDLLPRVVSLAHMHLLPIGRCVEGTSNRLRGVLRISQRQIRGEHLLDLSSTNTSLITRSSLPSARGRSVSASSQYDCNLLLVKPTANGPAALIPCAALFQLFWGVSSRIAGLVLTGKLEEPNRYMYDEARSSIDASGTVILILRQHMTDRDAPYLASLYAEPEALAAGRHIARQLAAETSRGSTSPMYRLEVTPPFARPMRLGGFCQTVPARATGLDHDVIFMSHVVSCDVRPAWNELIWGRENDGRPGKEGAIDDKDIDRVTFAVADRSRVPIELEDNAPGRHQESAPLEVLAPIQLKFPVIASLLREKLEKLNTSYTKVAVRVDPITGKRSAIDAKPATANDVVSADLTGGSELPYDDDFRTEADDVTQIHPRLAGFADTFGPSTQPVVIGSENAVVEVMFVHPYKPALREKRPVFFEVPRSIDDKRPAWMFRDPERRFRKRGLCVELILRREGAPSETRYVLDFEPRTTRRPGDGITEAETQNGYLGAWPVLPRSEAALTLRDLQEVINAVATRGNPRFLQQPAVGLATRSFRHVPDLLLERLVQRVFTATDQVAQSSSEGGSVDV